MTFPLCNRHCSRLSNTRQDHCLDVGRKCCSLVRANKKFCHHGDRHATIDLSRLHQRLGFLFGKHPLQPLWRARQEEHQCLQNTARASEGDEYSWGTVCAKLTEELLQKFWKRPLERTFRKAPPTYNLHLQRFSHMITPALALFHWSGHHGKCSWSHLGTSRWSSDLTRVRDFATAKTHLTQQIRILKTAIHSKRESNRATSINNSIKLHPYHVKLKHRKCYIENLQVIYVANCYIIRS